LREKPDRKVKNGDNAHVPSNVTELMQSFPINNEQMPPLQEQGQGKDMSNVSDVVTNLTSAVQAMSQVAVKLENAMQAANIAYGNPQYIPQPNGAAPAPLPIAPAPIPQPAQSTNIPIPSKPTRSTSRTMASIHLAPNAVPIQKHQITDNDVLFGRGGVTNNHVGNRRYRELVRAHQQAYLIAPKTEKAQIARKIVEIIRHHRDPPGRFLVKGEVNGTWVDVGDERSREKTSQALREKAPEMRRVLTAAAGLVGVNKVVMNKGNVLTDTLTGQPVGPVATKVLANAIQQQTDKKDMPSIPLPPPPMPQQPHQNPVYQQQQAPHLMYQQNPNQQQNYYNVAPHQQANMYYPQQQQTQQPQYARSTVQQQPYHLPSPPASAPVISQAIKNATTDQNIQITQNDVLYGRGAGINCHIGNQRFRQLVKYHQKSYLEAPKLLKGDIARSIVQSIRNATPPGRFLSQDGSSGKWIEVDDTKACEKTSQALREKAPELRKGLVLNHQKQPYTPPQTSSIPPTTLNNVQYQQKRNVQDASANQANKRVKAENTPQPMHPNHIEHQPLPVANPITQHQHPNIQQHQPHASAQQHHAPAAQHHVQQQQHSVQQQQHSVQQQHHSVQQQHHSVQQQPLANPLAPNVQEQQHPNNVQQAIPHVPQQPPQPVQHHPPQQSVPQQATPHQVPAPIPQAINKDVVSNPITNNPLENQTTT